MHLCKDPRHRIARPQRPLSEMATHARRGIAAGAREDHSRRAVGERRDVHRNPSLTLGEEHTACQL